MAAEHGITRLPDRKVRERAASWAGLAAAAVILIFFRLHAFELPLETDECNYAYIGKRLLAGDRLYVDVWDHQPPGVFTLFAAVIAVFGDAPRVFRWMAVGFSLATLALLFALARRLAGSAAAVGAALLFALASSDPGTAGEGCQREIYMNTLILGAWYLVARPGTPRRRDVATGGVLLGLASLIKTNVAVYWIAMALWTAWRACGTRLSARPGRAGQGLAPEPSPRPSPWEGEGVRSSGRAAWGAIQAVALLAVGPALIWAATGAYFLATSRWTEFVDAVFLFNLTYSDAGISVLSRMAVFFAPKRHPNILGSALPLWIGGGAAGVWFLIRVTDWLLRADRCPRPRLDLRPIAPAMAGTAVANSAEAMGSEVGMLGLPSPTASVSQALLSVLMLQAGFGAVILPAHFWPHYYYLLIPTLSVATAVAAHEVASLFGGGRNGWLGAGLTGIVGLSLGVTQYRDYLSQPPMGITAARYMTRDFWGRAQGENVRRVTEPADGVFVFGNDAGVYYYSGRRCASRYTMITALQVDDGRQAERLATLLDDLRVRRPRLILVLFDIPRPPREWAEFLREHYTEPVGWDRNDRTGEPIMFVVTRRDAPIPVLDWDWDLGAGWEPTR